MSPVDRRRFLEGLAASVAAAVLVQACSDGDRGPSARSTLPRPTGGEGGLDANGIPDTETIHGWIERIVDQGVRRPGYPADDWTERFAVDELRRAGVTDVRLEPVELRRWEPGEADLIVTTADGATARLECFPVPYAAPVESRSATLAAFDASQPQAVRGQAALVDARVVRIAPDALAGAGSAPVDRSRRVYDPEGTFVDTEQVLPHTAERRRILDPVIAAGATAFIGSLVDYPGGGHEYYVPYDGVARPIPGVWVSGRDGAWLRDRMEDGPVQIHLTVTARTEPAVSHNVVGVLPGADEELLIIGSHHDGPWASAVEDASGTALVLAQARYWASQPVRARPHRMVFVLHAGHMCGSAGLDAYLTAHEAELDRTVLEVHLEHVALEAVERDGVLTVTNQCTPRWFFTSRLPTLESAVYDAIVAEGLTRSMILAPDALGENPPTDGGRYHQHGVPLVQFLAAPSYLFDPADTIEKIDIDALVPLTRAAARIIAGTAGLSAATLRRGGA